MRWMVTSCFALVVWAPAFATAQPASQEAQLRLGAVELSPSAVGQFRWDLYAQLTAAGEHRGGAGGGVADVGVGGEIAIDNAACPIVVVGGQARVHRSDGERGLSAEQWASVCLMGGAWVPTVQLRHHLELDVRPAFSAAPTLRRRRFTRETIGFDIVEFRFPLPELGGVFEFAHLDLGVSFVVQDLGEERPGGLEAEVDMAMIRWVAPRATGPGLEVDVFGFHVREHMRDADGEYDTFVMELSPLRLRGIHLGNEVYLDADVAWAHGSVSEADTVGSLPLRRFDTVSADVAVERSHGPLSTSIGYRRQLAPTVDTDLILDDRISASLSLARGRADYAVSGFGARTQLFPAEGGVMPPELTGGAELSAGLDLGKGVRLGASAELARTYYARISGDSRPRAELGARFVGMLSSRFGSGF